MLSDLIKHRDVIAKHAEVLIPDVRWDGRRERSRKLGIGAPKA